MKTWKMLAAVPLVLLAGPALAGNWVVVATDDDGMTYSVDKDSIRRGDGVVTFTDYDDINDESAMAADCQRRIFYVIKGNLPNWRDHGEAVEPGSIGEAELNYVCANAR